MTDVSSARGASATATGRAATSLVVRPDYASMPGGFSDAGNTIDSLYVHVPFCTTKCHYCDFYSLAGHLDEADAFLDALAREAALWGETWGTISPSTIFIGGGTPTLLDAPRLQRLLGIVEKQIDRSRLVEFSVEGNPNTFDPARAAVLAGHGVNRLSFGAQSFVANELVTLQRDHHPENVGRAVAMARAAGIDDVNVDLIFGIPGQTLDSWEFSLASALALEPVHMSCYSLTYEPSTAMTARLKCGEFSAIDEELELAMFEHVYARMRGAGFTRYEVSNYARAGKECRHNVNYWKGASWAAWGPSAAGHVAGHRWKNVGSLNHYLEALAPAGARQRPLLPLTQMEHLSKTAWAGEVAAFWLRLSEGLGYAEFLERTGVDARPVLERVLAPYVGMGFVCLSPDRAALTEQAIAISNRILRDVVGAFDGVA